MKTVLLICAENSDTLFNQFVDALKKQHVAHDVQITSFAMLEETVRAIQGVDQVVIFPCVVVLSDTMRHDLMKRLEILQREKSDVALFLSNPLGCDPRLIEMVKDRMAVTLKGLQDAPILMIETGNGQQSLKFDDLSVLPDQIPDVSAIVPDRKGQGVWVRGVLPEIAHAQVVFYADDDRFSASVALDVVRQRGFFIYGLEGQPLPASYGGPVRLLIPGYDDRCANVKGVARIEIRS